MRKILCASLIFFSFLFAKAQTNMVTTNKLAEDIMLGNYDPMDFKPQIVIDQPEEIIDGILNQISTDSLKSYLFALRSFHNRNTGSDTLSLIKGIGAARRWTFDRFQKISEQNEGRLLPSYFQFDFNICGAGQHRNIFATLPGIDTSKHGIVLIEAHIDSRCDEVCDTTCLAEGMEDNASGTALVLELARIMSAYAFDRTLVFMLVIGEEQGLNGSDAFAKYALSKKIPINSVLNNDVIGGIICGQTSSTPSCPGFNNIDSTQVRLFSQGSFNSKHKQLARFTKLQYQEELLDKVSVPMKVTIMSAEDRTGRGGDHIPFRQQGFAAIRFTSANEHGNANTADPNYHDRQHTSDDILGLDTNADNLIDSFFVDFNYLSRNALINGVSAAMAGIGPETPSDFTAFRTKDSIHVNIVDNHDYGKYRVFYRFANNDFDTTFTIYNKNVVLKEQKGIVYLSVASVDENGIESLFTGEKTVGLPNSTIEPESEYSSSVIELLQNRPNPFDEATYINFNVKKPLAYKDAFIVITNLEGKEIKRIPVQIKTGNNEILYTHGYNVTGVYAYSLIIDGKIVATRRMVFAN